MELFGTDLFWPIAGAVIAGMVIGAEREYRSSPAGLRTHVLVSLSCCLLMLSAVHQMAWLNDAPHDVIRIDPVRMAHGILTGIGFLCGGVIFREGLNVRGLTTAASLWMTATLGMLFGIGFHELAIFGAVMTLLVLAAIAITERYAPQRRIVHIRVCYRRTAAIGATAFDTFLKAHDMRALGIHQKLDGDNVELSATADGYSDAHAERLVQSMNGNADIVGFEIRPQQA